MNIPYYSDNPLFHKEHVYAVVFHPDKRITRHFVKPGPKGITIGKILYNIDPECGYLTGRFRVVTYYYMYDKLAPMHFDKIPAFSTQLSGERYQTGVNSHALSEALKGFDESYSPLMLALVTMGVVVLTGVALYFTIGKPVQELHSFIIPTPTPVGTPLGGLHDAP